MLIKSSYTLLIIFITLLTDFVAIACGETSLYGPTGVIMSPNHPEYYPKNLNCSFNLYASSGSSFSFIFKLFSTLKTVSIL